MRSRARVTSTRGVLSATRMRGHSYLIRIDPRVPREPLLPRVVGVWRRMPNSATTTTTRRGSRTGVQIALCVRENACVRAIPRRQ